MICLLALALIHGLVYAFLLPPWQHYDEPKHFEYVGQIVAGDPGLDTQVRLSNQIADSMYRHRFWPAGSIPDLLGPQPAQIGENQRLHPPLYYTLVAFWIAPLRAAPVEWQLYAGRLLSVALYALTIVALWRITVTIAPDEPVIQIVLPLLALLAPAFADLMSAVNNDVLVNFTAAAMLLGCALMIRDGPTPSGLLLSLLGLACALLTKRTAIVAVVPCVVALLWAFRRRPLPWWAYLGSVLGVGAVVLPLGFRLELVETTLGPRLSLLPRDWLDAFDQAYLRLYITNWLRSVADVERSGPLYVRVVQIVFESFWARMAWGQIALGAAGELGVAAVSTVSALGLALWTWRGRGQASVCQQRWVALCALAVACGWAAAVARLHPLPQEASAIYLPRGRYMFWAFLPHVWLIALGWQSVMPERWRAYSPYILLLLFAALDVGGLVALTRAYYGGAGG